MDYESDRLEDERRQKLLRDERRVHPQYDLRFDGRKLALRENGKPIVDWPAVSGRPDFQHPKFQSHVDQGPLPQGSYRFSVSDMQRFENTDAYDRLKGRFGGGGWPGGQKSWGNYRFWLAPSAGTQTLGRGNFSIHGGYEPGSAGCIDLTDEMDEFADLMQAIGQDQINVEVDYESNWSPNHRYR